MLTKKSPLSAYHMRITISTGRSSKCFDGHFFLTCESRDIGDLLLDATIVSRRRRFSSANRRFSTRNRLQFRADWSNADSIALWRFSEDIFCKFQQAVRTEFKKSAEMLVNIPDSHVKRVPTLRNTRSRYENLPWCLEKCGIQQNPGQRILPSW
jgi:hypothetical protein